MGQYWKVINLDKGVTFGSWGQLGEFLLSLPDCLEKSIRGGSTLPDRDAMVEPFKPGEVFREGYNREPIISIPALFFSPTAIQSTALLLSLPVEIIDAIYLEMRTLEDVLCFSVTCQTLWAIGRDHIYRHITARVAPHSWVGDRILCVGDYLQNADIPVGILTPEEQNDLLWDGDDEEDGGTLYEYPFEQISFRGPQIWGDSHRRLGYHTFETMVFFKLCMLDIPEPSPPPSLVVLRNLSQQQYVRESALLALKAKHADSGRELRRKLAHVGLGEILMTRICLSSDPSASLVWDGAIHRGVWAGDRFDTVDEEEFLRGDIDGAWTDVSGEVLGDLEAIWAAEFGS
ncbi:hypothetical protein C8R46DRAFT_1352757 [Mycena filopes]|nr:hypothetical protein C8R46DRAFT_1352757 [Mycena filopes]